MERLTIKAPSGLIHLKDGEDMTANAAIKKLSDYEDLEEQGLLLKPKCKVGDIAYFPDENFNYIFSVTISKIVISDLGEGKYCTQYNGCFFNGYGDPEKDFGFDEDDFDKTVFLTQSKSEEVLKGMEGEKIEAD